MKEVLFVLWATVGVVLPAPATPPAAKDEVVLRDVTPGATEVTVPGSHLLSRIPGVVRTGQTFGLSEIRTLFPELGDVGSSSFGSTSSGLPILLLGSGPHPSQAAASNFVRVNRQSLVRDSAELEDIISDERISLEDNLVFTAGEGDPRSREGGFEVVSGSPDRPSSVGVPLSAAVASISSSDSSVSSSGTSVSSSSTSISSSGSPVIGSLDASTSSSVNPISSSVSLIPSAEIDASSRTVANPPPPTDSLAPATAPSSAGASPGRPLPKGLGMLLNRHSAQVNDPSMTLGSFLMGLNGKNGVMVLPSSSLDVVQNGGGTGTGSADLESSAGTEIRVDVDGDDVHDFELDISSSEAEELGIIASSNPSTEAATTTSTTTSTTTQSPLIQGQLTRLLTSKGKFFGTILGGLLDLGSIIMRRLMVFKPF